MVTVEFLVQEIDKIVSRKFTGVERLVAISDIRTILEKIIDGTDIEEVKNELREYFFTLFDDVMNEKEINDTVEKLVKLAKLALMRRVVRRRPTFMLR